MNEQDTRNDLLNRVQKVFGGNPPSFGLSPQQDRMLYSLLGKEWDATDGKVTDDAIEGIKQLVTEELWHPELTRLSSKSKDSAPTSSETSESSTAQPDPEPEMKAAREAYEHRLMELASKENKK